MFRGLYNYLEQEKRGKIREDLMEGKYGDKVLEHVCKAL